MEHTTNTPLADEYMQSLKGMQPADLPPFFYTRLKARMETDATPKPSFLLRPVLAVAALSVVLLLNIVALVQQHRKVLPEESKNTTIEQFTSDFNLTTNSNY